MLGAMRTEAPRKVAVAYDTLEAGRQMLAWAARFCLQRNDELHLVQYCKVSHCGMTSVGVSPCGTGTHARGERYLLGLSVEKERTKGQGQHHAIREKEVSVLRCVCWA